MALDALHGLPSFSEMLQAFKNRTSLGETLQTGLAGYEKGVGMKTAAAKEVSESDLRSAQAEEARAKAKNLGSTTSKKRVPLAALPETIKPQLASYVDEEGMVPYEAAQVALSTTEQGRKAEGANKELEMRQQQLEQSRKSQEENLALRQQIADLQAQLGPKAQELSAARAVVEATGKQEAPSLLQKGVSAVKEGLGGQPLESVLNERMQSAATKKLAEMGRITPPSAEPQLRQPAPRPAPTSIPQGGDLRSRAISELQSAGAPVTEANIQEAMRQLGAR